MKTDLQSYYILRSDLKESPQTPRAYYPKISQEDYDKGYIERYFLQKSDTKGAPIYEVKRTVYSNYYSTPFYIGGILVLYWCYIKMENSRRFS